MKNAIDNAARSIPRWAAAVVSRLSQDEPAVVTRADMARYLEDLGEQRDVEETLRELQRLGWLATLHVRGAWAFVPAGQVHSADPYLDLRGWRAREPNCLFALAGEAAAWHLGYVKRRFEGTLALWIPPGERVPSGIRARTSAVRLSWSPDQVKLMGPAPRLLRRKNLDLTAWSSGLPAFGPEALLVQLTTRPSSFRTWADLVSQLDVLTSDCDLERLALLLRGQSGSAWQRAAYLLERGGRRDDGVLLLRRRPHASLASVTLGDGETAVWSSEFMINDRLVAPLQEQLGKA